MEIKELEFCKYQIDYAFNAQDVLKKRNEISKIFRNAPVPGHRKGKATKATVALYYKSQINDSLKRALAEEAFHNSVFEKELDVFGEPQFSKIDLINNAFECSFVVFVKPNIEIKNISNTIPKPHINCEQSHLSEQIMQDLRVKCGGVSPYTDDDFVQFGDNIIIDYEGFVDSKKIDTICAIGEMLTVGKSELSSFDDNLLGMKPGDTRTFEIDIPKNGIPELANKTVKFEVSVVSGSKIIPHPLDDELAVKCGKTTFAELKELVSMSASSRIDYLKRDAERNAVCSKLINDNEFAIPEWMITSEASYLASKSNIDFTTIAADDKARFINSATNNVKLALILDKVRKSEPEAQLSDEEVYNIARTHISKSVNRPLEDVMKEMTASGHLQILFSRIRDEHTIDFVRSKTIFVE